MTEHTWRGVATIRPEFVQWIVATYGPLPDGPIRQEDYERFVIAYQASPNDAIETA